MANVSWLPLSAANQGGKGSANVIFTYDENANLTRYGTITIGGLTLTVTVTNSGSGVFQFTSAPTTNDTQRFYTVRSP